MNFWTDLISTWWGILIVCVVAVAVWLALSVLLYKQFFKRFYDIVLSFVALIVLSPLLLVLTIVGAIAMKGNPFFVQERPGKRNKLSKKQCETKSVPPGSFGDEKIIHLIKFRTMTFDKDADGNLLPDEKRLNSYGKFLRKTSCDELPSLLNIFIGELSIVGPRPQLKVDLQFMNDTIRKRHNVTPGLTGLAQVNGRNNIAWDEKFEYDLKYIDNITFFGDIKIILKTVGKVFKRSDINRDGTASDINYGEWLLQNDKITQTEYENTLKEAA